MIPFVPTIAKFRTQIIWLFRVGYLGLFLYGLLNVLHVIQLDVVDSHLATLSVAFFITSTLPGILTRFRLKTGLGTIGLMFRRQIGITAFLFGTLHGVVNYIAPSLQFSGTIFPLSTPVLFGVVALILMSFLFLTSNDWSVKKMGKWWKKLHKLTYVIYWLVFIHAALMEIGMTTIVIGLLATTEVISLLFDAFSQSNKK